MKKAGFVVLRPDVFSQAREMFLDAEGKSGH
jgi:hypothetical protein